MKIIAGRNTIVTKPLDLDPGLFALVHEGSRDGSRASVHVVHGFGDANDLVIRPINAMRQGGIDDGQLILLNAINPCRALIVITGATAETAKVQLRLVSLDMAARFEARKQMPLLVPPSAHRPLFSDDDPSAVLGESSVGTTTGFSEAYQTRLVEMAVGAHLIRFPRSERASSTSLLMSPAAGDSEILVAANPPATRVMQRGQVAVLDCASPAMVFLTLVGEGFDLSDFAGVMFEPLEQTLQRLSAARKPANPTDGSIAKVAQHQPALQALRLSWPKRPLGLDLAVALRPAGQQSFDQTVMSGTWLRSASPEGITGVRIALIGIKRSVWSLEVEATDTDGSQHRATGPSVELTSTLACFMHITARAVPRSGPAQKLELEYQ